MIPGMFLIVAQIAVFLGQIMAFQAGMEYAWGWGWVGSIIIAAVVSCLPLGGVFMAIMTFYGACYAWDWHWWQAGLLAAPGFALSIAAIATGGLLGAFRRG